jgi:DHA1 family bicyclomycin/chloramphenicol resistance-like MFS transporter
MLGARIHTRAFRSGFAALLAALAALGPFSIDTYLPAFAGIQESLATTPVGVQQTLSAYLFAFGVMFLFHGALSDAFGRRPVILVSVAVFILASAGAALAGSLESLLFWRVVQGLCVGAGMVVGRAMIRDLFGMEEAQRLMSLVTLFFGAAPVVAPVIGGWLYVTLGWRSIFWLLVAIGAVLLAVCLRFLPETLAEPSRQPFHPVALLKGYEEVGMNPRFLWLSLAVGFNFNAFFLYIVSAPVFLGAHLGLGPQQYAWLFVPCIVGIMTGAQLSGYAAGRLKPAQTIRFAYVFMGVSAFGCLAYAFVDSPAVPWAILPIMTYAIGSAMAMPSISLLTLDLFPTRRGMAASLQGFVSGMVNTLTAGLIAAVLWEDPKHLAAGMVAMMLIGLGSWTMYLRDLHRAPREPAPGPEL